MPRAVRRAVGRVTLCSNYQPDCDMSHHLVGHFISFSTELYPGNRGSEHRVIKARGAGEGKKAAHHGVREGPGGNDDGLKTCI